MAKKIISFILFISMEGCFGTAEKSADEPVSRIHYTLENGETVNHPKPLPNEIPVYIKWHMSDGSVEKLLGFRGWDFNRDGKFEMLEILNEDGSIQSYSYDFDGDGNIDAVADAATNQLRKASGSIHDMVPVYYAH